MWFEDDDAEHNPIPRLSLSQLILESSQPELSQLSQPTSPFQSSQPSRLSQPSQTKSQEIAAPVTPGKKAERRKTKKRKRRGPRTYGRIKEEDEDEDSVLETQSEANRREARELKNKRRQGIQERWKFRKLDLRDEEDTDGAFKNLIMMLLNKNNKEPLNNENGTNKIEEWEEGEDFWKLGRIKRYKTNIFNASSIYIKKKKNLPRKKNKKAKFPVLKDMPQRSELVESKEYYPLQHALNCPADVFHFHRGTIAGLAIKYLLCHHGEDEIFEDKLLKCLFKIKNHNSRKGSITTLANIRGFKVNTFLKYLWKDKAEAFKLLGINNESEFKFKFDNYRAPTSSEERLKKTVRRQVNAIVRKKSLSQIIEINAENEINLKNEIDQSDDDGTESEKSIEQSSYGYVKGSIPPVPHRLLEELNIVFGEEDPNSQRVICNFAGPNARIDTSTSSILLSTLVSRLALAQQTQDGKKMESINEDIISFLKLLRKRNSYRNDQGEGGAVLEYESIMQCCMYYANSAIVDEEEEQEDDQEMLIKQEMDDALPNFSFDNANSAASRISTIIESMRKRKSILPFPRIHLIHALCVICGEIPLVTVDVIAKSRENPIMTVKNFLEFLEKNEILEDDGDGTLSLDTITSSQVQHLFSWASEIIESRCVTATSFIEYDAWLVGLRLGILLLSSGIKIGCESAYLFPSFKLMGEDVDAIFSETKPKLTLPHEIRISRGFAKMRLEAAECMLNFIEKADRIGNRGSDLIISLLEWSQVLALLLGPTKEKIPLEQESRWKQIRLLHGMHKIQSSQVSLSEAEKLESCGHIDENSFLDHLASNLEKDPRNISHWRRLVKKLGHLEQHVEGSNQPKLEKIDYGEESNSLQEKTHVNRGKREDIGWWGCKRQSWWRLHLLNHVGKVAESKPKQISDMFDLLKRKLKKKDFPSSDSNLSSTAGDETSSQSPPKIQLKWLKAIIKICRKEEKDKFKTPDVNLRKVAVNQLLPNANTSMKNDNSAVELPAILDLIEKDPFIEIECYKILLMAHLYGVNHKAVGSGLWHFTYNLRNRTTGHHTLFHDTVICLRWLQKYGLDPILVLEKYHADNFNATSMETNLTLEDIYL